MIEARVLKKLGQFSLNAEISDSGFICLAGRNGAGKTTFLRTIAGLTGADEVSVRVNGNDVFSQPTEKRRIVLVTPGSFIPHLNVDSHIAWGARLGGSAPLQANIDELKGRLGIHFGGPVGQLSLGTRERVGLATAFFSSPNVILVDEAFSNLHERETFISSYRTLTKGAGIDVVFSSQDERDGRLSDHLYTVTEGKTERIS